MQRKEYIFEETSLNLNLTALRIVTHFQRIGTWSIGPLFSLNCEIFFQFVFLIGASARGRCRCGVSFHINLVLSCQFRCGVFLPVNLGGLPAWEITVEQKCSSYEVPYRSL